MKNAGALLGSKNQFHFERFATGARTDWNRQLLSVRDDGVFGDRRVEEDRNVPIAHLATPAGSPHGDEQMDLEVAR